MAKEPKKNVDRARMLHYARFLMAIFALLIAATHFPFAGTSAGAPTSHVTPPTTNTSTISHTSGTYTTTAAPSFGGGLDIGLWFDIEIVAYGIIAVIYLLGLRTFYIYSTIFNAFNLGIYLLSGLTAIPGVTGAAFGSHLAIISSSLNNNVLMVSWFAALVLSLILLKYDNGSELDRLIVTERKD